VVKHKAGKSEGNTKAKMEMLMKRVAGNVLEKTINLKEKVVNFLELSDEEWDEEER